MTPELFLRLGVAPAMRLLPQQMTSAEAAALVLAISFQESRLHYRRQIGGPARSYVQFEKGGIRGVLNHDASRAAATDLCEALDVKPDVESVYAAIEFHDVLCAGFARLLLWTLPDALPGPEETTKAWRCYVDAGRPGKPRPESWAPFYEEAWTTVLGHPPAERFLADSGGLRRTEELT